MTEEKGYLKEFYTLEALSAEVGITVQTLRKAIKAGQLNASKVCNKYVLRRDSVIEWLDSAQA